MRPKALSTAAASGRSGLTLIEVLVALAIFLLSYVAIIRLISLGEDQALEIRWQSEGTRLAQSKMAEVVAGVIPLLSQSDQPFDNTGSSAWNWSMSCEQETIPNLWQAEVTVSRDRPDGSLFEVTLSRLVIDPTTRGNLAANPEAEEELPPEETETPIP